MNSSWTMTVSFNFSLLFIYKVVPLHFHSGSLNQFIGVYNTSGDNLSTIKYHEGFLGQRIGAANCMAFHPHKVCTGSRGTGNFNLKYCVLVH